MRLTLALMIAAVLSVTAAAKTATDPTVGKATGVVLISGNRAVERTQVVFRGAETFTATVKHAGRYSISLPDGEYRVAIVRRGGLIRYQSYPDRISIMGTATTETTLEAR